MQTITIVLTVPDGVTVSVNTATNAVNTPVIAATPDGPKFEDVKRAFVAAVGRNKVEGISVCNGFLAAEQVKTLADFPAARYGDLIAKFEGVK